MKPLIIKTAVVLAGVSGLGIAAHQGYKALTDKDISVQENKVDNKKEKVKDRLSKDKYELLDSQSTNDQHWTNILNSYKELTKSEVTLKFDGLNGEEGNAKQELQKLCAKDLESEDMSNYEKIKKWCVVPVDISSLLEKRGFVILKTDSGDSSDNVTWAKKITDYKKLDTDTLKISELRLTDNKEQVDESDYTNIKQKCSEIKTKKNYEADFESLLKKFESWCANKTS